MGDSSSDRRRPPFEPIGPRRMWLFDRPMPPRPRDRVLEPQAEAETGDLPEQRIFMLSIDGGGIYGLTSATWMRQICEADPRFLSEGTVDLFAGCSSGALNCLLLARHASPREAVLAGELERFWKGQAIFANSDPVNAALSWVGLAPWFGTRDFLDYLEQWFGNLRLGDLPNTVLISTYNWSGATDEERVWTTPFEAFRTWASSGDASGLLAPVADRMNLRTRAGQRQRHWKPKFFDNGRADDLDLDQKVSDVAYAASAPPGFRALRGGLGDGASFNANPSVNAIIYMLDQWEQGLDQLCSTADGRQQLRSELWDRLRIEIADDDALRDHFKFQLVGDVLRRTVMISMGPGQRLPHYGYANIGFGFNLFQAVPTNPWRSIWEGPSSFSLDAPSSDAEFIARQLLHERNYIRLNPDIMVVPTVLAAWYARFPVAREWIVGQIEEATRSEISRLSVDNTVRFLAERLWPHRREEE